MSKILFSIICPIYNAKAFLGNAIKSLLNQGYDNWELILIDDGSTDGSALLCDDFSARDERINVIHQENQGQSKARLVGIEKSRGDYVLFLDSDDFFDLTALDELNEEIMKSLPDAILFDARRKSGEILSPVYFLNRYKFLTEKKEILNECFGIRIAGYFWTYCFKRELFDLTASTKETFATIKYSEDVYLISQIITNKVKTFSVLPQPLYVYIDNALSITHNQTVEKVKDRFNVFNGVYENLCHDHQLTLKSSVVSNIGWTYLSFLSRAAKEYDFERFKETAKGIRSSYIFKRLSRFKKDKYNSLVHFLLKIRMYKKVYLIIRKH